MSSSSLPAFGPTCPLGGTWWACSTGANFVGCCAGNPCASTCPQGNLYAASFNAARYGTFRDATCGSGSQFYTCTGTNPPFLGCCKTNPCAAGSCTRDNLSPAFLSTDDERSVYGASGGSSSSSRLSSSTSVARSSSTNTPIRSSTLSTTVSGTTRAATTATQDAAAVVPKKDGPPVAAIAGGAAGGAFALAVIVGLLIYYFCHAKKSRKGHEETVVRRQSDLPVMVTVQGKDSAMHDAPPGYASPNPNDYYGSHAGQYHQQQHQYMPEPQELPSESRSPAFFTSKPAAAGHQRNFSELSGDTAIRSELDTPVGTPHAQSQCTTPFSSPPGQTHAGWQSSPNAQTGSNWTPHQSWQTQGEQGYVHGPPQGLGLNGSGVNEMGGTELRAGNNMTNFRQT